MARYAKAQLNAEQRAAVRKLKLMRNAITLVIEEIEIDGMPAGKALDKVAKLLTEKENA